LADGDDFAKVIYASVNEVVDKTCFLNSLLFAGCHLDSVNYCVPRNCATFISAISLVSIDKF